MKKITGIILLIAINVQIVLAQPANSPQIKIQNGVLQGVTEESGIRSFKGIPFAKPPVGDLRWKEPMSPENWQGVRKADHFAPQAMQRPIYGDMVFRSDGRSEDCLYLNVWTPAKSSSEKLPVLVYFYGGGFNAGDGSEYRYDGESMAKRGIVSVTVNYRLGVFGFLAHPGLTTESEHHSSGNYGLLDQHAALVWVQKNIAAFGGDPKRVTIGGESAGSMSVSAQVASPLSKGLFAGAIAESGSILANLSPVPLADAEQNGVKFANNIGASTLADLRKLPADQLLELSASASFPRVVDGYFLPESPNGIFEAGKQMRVPLLAGWNSTEVDYHSVLGKDEPTLVNYKNALQRMYGAHADEVLAAYPATTDADVMKVATDLASDRFIDYATWKFIDLQRQTSGKSVYPYVFARKRPTMVSGQVNTALGAVHASEIEYALGNLPYNKVYAWTPEDFKVSATMESYFANFIKTGNPNGAGLPNWPNLHKTQSEFMLIDVNSAAQPFTNLNRYQLPASFFNR